MAPQVLTAQEARGEGSRADTPTVLWHHVNTAADLGELRAMTADWDAGDGGVLRLAATKPGTYAWAVVPAPKAGWDLLHHATVEAEIANTGSEPADVMLWVVGDRGWDAVPDSAKLVPGATRRFSCRLRETFPDGTPKIDPGQVRQIQVMLLRPTEGVKVEVRRLQAHGDAPPWKRPTGRMDVPPIEDGLPAPGKRVRFRLPGDEKTGIYSVLHLPTDWKAGGRYPLIVEYPGNIFFVPACYSTGLPDQCVIGYGITQGKGAICLSLPFVDRKTNAIAENGWGNPDDTADYAVAMADEICDKFGADCKNILLTGFSRGAIACGFIGLRNDRIASLWKGYHACQHYDGDGWGGATMESALLRARRFTGKAVFQTDNSAKAFGPISDAMKTTATYAKSSLGAHACAMFLDERPSTQQLRQWFAELIQSP